MLPVIELDWGFLTPLGLQNDTLMRFECGRVHATFGTVPLFQMDLFITVFGIRIIFKEFAIDFQALFLDRFLS